VALYFLDSSALVKRYLQEGGSAFIERLVESEAIIISLLALPEVASAFARRVRAATLGPEQQALLYQKLLDDIERIPSAAVSDVILRRASVLVADREIRGLRAADAIHLATAEQSFILARESGIHECVFVCAEGRLREAALTIGMTVADPEDHA
jgi:predicted nucleic acid-binding protein